MKPTFPSLHVVCILPVSHTEKRAQMAAAASRAPSQLARRDALSLTVSAPRLSDLLSNSRRR